jgi:hypothetical protein
MPTDRETHIGEHDAKTNAIRDFPQVPIASAFGRYGPAAATAECRLLPVVRQHAKARRDQLGTILLEASQYGKIALIYHRSAEALNVARASPLLLGRAAALLGDGDGGNGDQQQHESRNHFTHRVLSFEGRGIRIPARAGRGILIANAANPGKARTKSAGKCGQIYGGSDRKSHSEPPHPFHNHLI